MERIYHFQFKLTSCCTYQPFPFSHYQTHRWSSKLLVYLCLGLPCLNIGMYDQPPQMDHTWYGDLQTETQPHRHRKERKTLNYFFFPVTHKKSRTVHREMSKGQMNTTACLFLCNLKLTRSKTSMVGGPNFVHVLQFVWEPLKWSNYCPKNWYCQMLTIHIWRACFQNLLHPPRHITHLHYWLPFCN